MRSDNRPAPIVTARRPAHVAVPNPAQQLASADESGHRRNTLNGQILLMQIDEGILAGLTILDLSGKLTIGDGAQLLNDRLVAVFETFETEETAVQSYPAAVSA